MRKAFLLLLSLSLLLTLSGCDQTKTGSEESDNALAAFNAVVEKYPDNKGFHSEMLHWGLALPGEDKFEWTKDTSESDIDFAMAMKAEPFVEAGLDPDKLPSDDYIYLEESTKKKMEAPARIAHPFNVSDEKEVAQGSEDAMRRLLKQNNDLVQYHEEMGRYRLYLGEGYEVQWTDDLTSGEPEITFILQADPLVQAGLDVEELDGSGWVYQPAGEDEMESYPNRLVMSYDLSE